jgi:hypothetical protein
VRMVMRRHHQPRPPHHDVDRALDASRAQASHLLGAPKPQYAQVVRTRLVPGAGSAPAIPTGGRRVALLGVAVITALICRCAR